MTQYYQRMYGEAFIDLCERSLARMDDNSNDNNSSSDGGGGGTIIGISSPGVSAHYYMNRLVLYSMPGSGKSLVEYSMRIHAGRVASRGINVNCL